MNRSFGKPLLILLLPFSLYALFSMVGVTYSVTPQEARPERKTVGEAVGSALHRAKEGVVGAGKAVKRTIFGEPHERVSDSEAIALRKIDLGTAEKELTRVTERLEMARKEHAAAESTVNSLRNALAEAEQREAEAARHRMQTTPA